MNRYPLGDSACPARAVRIDGRLARGADWQLALQSIGTLTQMSRASMRGPQASDSLRAPVRSASLRRLGGGLGGGAGFAGGLGVCASVRVAVWIVQGKG